MGDEDVDAGRAEPAQSGHQLREAVDGAGRGRRVVRTGEGGRRGEAERGGHVDAELQRRAVGLRPGTQQTRPGRMGMSRPPAAQRSRKRA